MIVYPALDLRAGRVVRIEQGDFARETRYERDPAAVAGDYALDGARWVHVVDLEAARLGRFLEHDTLIRIAFDNRLSVQAGGGVRSGGDVEMLLEAGAARVVVGSAAVRQPELVASWIAQYGSERICVALDTRPDERGQLRLPVGGWQQETRFTLFELLERFTRHASLKHLLCTDIVRDGQLTGPNLELYAELRERFPHLEVQAAGGVRCGEDVRRLAALGVSGVVIGKALMARQANLPELLGAARASAQRPADS
jgi:phosphoribosylformimino-5-aminoimidazole carboxamide ribotide isomerase